MKIALITGVAGGIGLATARLFTRTGWRVYGVDIQACPDAAALHLFLTADLSAPTAVDQVVAAVEAREGGLHALVNNAALQICRPLLATEAHDFDRVIAVNLRAPWLLTKRAYKLLANSRGAVVNVCSVHSLATSRDIGIYAASKAGLLSLTRTMSLEFASDGIRVNAVLPGAVDTVMLRAGLGRGDPGREETAQQLARLAQQHPVGRVGLPSEIAAAILFLADGEQSSFMTGQGLVVDGGALARLSTE